MSLFFCILFKMSLIGSLTGIAQEDYRFVCRLNQNIYGPLTKFLEKQDSYKDCDHSVGFHVTKELCQQMGFHSHPLLRAFTAYSTDQMIILFVNIAVTKESLNRPMKTFDLSVTGQLHDHFKRYFTVVWIKTVLKDDSTDSKLIYQISYQKERNGSNITFNTTNLKESLRSDQQIILKEVRTVGFKQEITVTGNQRVYSVEDSYLILCLVKDTTKFIKCKPIQVNDWGIGCDCEAENQLTTVLIFLVFWAIMVSIALKPLADLLLDKGDADRTDYPMAISCNAKNAKFEYIIGIHLAKSSTDFDLSGVNIDIEFLTSSNENVAPVFRFKASVLERQMITQIRLFMWRLTKLPELKRIQCCHSGRSDGRITIFGVFVYCRKGADDFKIYQINKDIVRETRMFRMVRENESNEKVLEDEQLRLRTLSNFEVNYTFLELLWILFVNITVIALTASMSESFVSLDLLGMLILVLISASVDTLFNFVFLKFYKCLLLGELKQQSKMNSRYEKLYFFGTRFFYILTILMSVIIGMVIGLKSFFKKTIDTYKWVCVTFCATALSLLVYEIFSHISCSKSKSTSEHSEEATVSSIGSASHEPIDN